MSSFVYNLNKPIDKLDPVQHFQMRVFNTVSLFFGILMNILSLQIIAFNTGYNSETQIYLALHNTLVSLGFFICFALGKSKHYKYSVPLFHIVFFIGSVVTLLNVPNKNMFLEVYPYLGIQLLLASFFYNVKKLTIHYSLIIVALTIVTANSPTISAKEMVQSSLLILTIYGLGLLGIKVREKIIEEVRNERLKTAKSTRIKTLLEINSELSHELNNPLTIITSANEVAKLELYNSTINKAKVIELIEKSDRTVSRISKTIKTFNQISEKEAEF